MARNGAGTYNLPAGQPVVTGTVISSTTFNTLTSDIATALTASIANDGQTVPVANLPMGGFKLTGLGDATVANDAIRYNGALGTPSSGTVTNLTGTASININGTVGSTTPTTGVFTTAKAIAASTQDAVLLQGRAGGTSSYIATITPTTLTASRTVTIPDASITIAGIDKYQSFSKAQVGTPVALSVSANAVAVDLSLGNNFTLTLQATTAQTLSNPTNVVAGQKGAIYITQNATPSTLAFASNWIEATTGTTPSVSTTAGARNILTYDVFDSTHIYYTLMTAGVS